MVYAPYAYLFPLHNHILFSPFSIQFLSKYTFILYLNITITMSKKFIPVVKFGTNRKWIL